MGGGPRLVFDGPPALTDLAMAAGLTIRESAAVVTLGGRWDASTLIRPDAAMIHRYEEQTNHRVDFSNGRMREVVVGLTPESILYKRFNSVTQVFEQPFTVQQYLDSSDVKWRCEASWRGSTSGNAFIAKDRAGKPYVIDNGSGVKLVMRDSFEALVKTMERQPAPAVAAPEHDPAPLTLMDELQAAGLAPISAESLTGLLVDEPRPAGWPKPQTITEVEWFAAKTHPPCIVENYIWADVRLLVAPGGVGKTTVVLTESIHIVLARPLYGLEIKESGVVVIVTAEDGREMMIARLRSIAKGMNLAEEEERLVRERVIILDVVGMGLRLTAVTDNIVVTDCAVSQMIGNLKPLKPSMVIIDPAVSFGVGESRVNDAEQGLIEAARHIHRELGCNVTYIHHTGQSVARDKIRDQYAGRGGSAFADGSRMVNVLMPLTAEEWLKGTGQPLPEGSTGIVLARAKQTYTPPQPDIYLLRTGFLYTAVEPVEPSPTAKMEAEVAKILSIFEADTSNELTGNKLELMSKDIGIGQKRIRDLLKVLIDDGRVTKVDKTGVKKGARYYLAIAEQHSTNLSKEAEQ